MTRKDGRESKMKPYMGAYADPFTFCTNFYRILFKCRFTDGSHIPNVIVEVCIVGALSALAVYLNEYVYEERESIAITGHQVFGVMIAFLIVFRSQIAWGMYTEGRAHLGEVIQATRDLGLEVISTLCAGQVSVAHQVEASLIRRRLTVDDSDASLELSCSWQEESTSKVAHFREDNLVLAYEVARMLKLFYFCMVEHLRSSEGTPVWKEAHRCMLRYATLAEQSELLLEFGGPQEGNRCERVTRTFHFERAAGENNVTSTVTQSPTRAKPLLVLAWVRMTLERGVNEGLLRDQQLTSFSAGMTELVRALGGVAKVDTMVLPFPYVQLLRWSLLIFCFTLPFVMATELQWWNIPLCMVTTCAFYGFVYTNRRTRRAHRLPPPDPRMPPHHAVHVTSLCTYRAQVG